VKCFGRWLIITIFLLIIFSGCATKVAVKRETDEELLRQRVMAYWNYKIEQKFDKSYEYEDPLFRKEVDMVNYIRSFHVGRFAWAGASIEQIHTEGDVATVDMKMTIKVMLSHSKNLESQSFVKEKWVKVDGNWYHIPEKYRGLQSAH
jgi:hypothetical protein